MNFNEHDYINESNETIAKIIVNVKTKIFVTSNKKWRIKGE